MMKYYYVFNTKYGLFTFVEEDNFLVAITKYTQIEDATCFKTSLLAEAFRQVEEYFDGIRFEFTIPICLKGTEFQIKVWNALQTIPYGKCVSYQDVAIQIGNQKAIRAVGMANHRNPIPFIVPCHRVIGKNGKLTGYAFGLELKEKLLKMEGLK